MHSILPVDSYHHVASPFPRSLTMSRPAQDMTTASSDEIERQASHLAPADPVPHTHVREVLQADKDRLGSTLSQHQSMLRSHHKSSAASGSSSENASSFDSGMSPLMRFGPGLSNFHVDGKSSTSSTSSTGASSHIAKSSGQHERNSPAKKWWRDQIGRFGTKRKAPFPPAHEVSMNTQRDQAMAGQEDLQGTSLPAGPTFDAPSANVGSDAHHLKTDGGGEPISFPPQNLIGKRLPKISKPNAASKQFEISNAIVNTPGQDSMWSIGAHVSTPAPSHAPPSEGRPESNTTILAGAMSTLDSGYTNLQGAGIQRRLEPSAVEGETENSDNVMARSPSARGSMNSITMGTATPLSDAQTDCAPQSLGQVLTQQRKFTTVASPQPPLLAKGINSVVGRNDSFAQHFQPYPMYALDDFEPQITLGTGTFGRVLLVKHKHANANDPSAYMALKALDKTNIVLLKQVAHVNAERTVLSKVDHPFIVKLYCTYQDSLNCYMLMEFVTGGEIFTHLRRARRFPVGVTRFYIASLVLALSHLHSRHILYRDLKPENLLIDSTGYIKVADFGFAKELYGENERAWTLCGTPEYLSPEVIQSKGQTFASDYWALGILMYEMLCGFPPFYADRPFATYEKILQCNVQFPSHVDPVSRHLIQSFLSKDLSKRLGNLSGGVNDIMRHPWFDGVDWQGLLARRLPAPIVPRQARAGDTANFQRFDEYDIDSMPGLQGMENARAKMPAEAMVPYTSQLDGIENDELAETDPYRHFFRDF